MVNISKTNLITFAFTLCCIALYAAAFSTYWVKMKIHLVGVSTPTQPEGTTILYEKWDKNKLTVYPAAGGEIKMTVDVEQTDANKNAQNIFKTSFAFAIIAFAFSVFSALMISTYMFFKRMPFHSIIVKVLLVMMAVCGLISALTFLGLPKAMHKDCTNNGLANCEQLNYYHKVIGSQVIEYNPTGTVYIEYKWGPTYGWALVLCGAGLSVIAMSFNFARGKFDEETAH
ncbi:hypothetical protein DFA_10453 [Cavenderia fasciculata]|uniref:Transmembrane protein n=1 Tax=Cavenderia fasciculata TaxID=261658 RepID=F4QA92_CACFS|nr:uncharacterized protein DFA_10453 [Cavenderia fasciculata]EGG15611.1 hypothetical protein DFA_10453 [Cavenderia fasciculata]|eukprot:XP_004354353.1 hypothetical protein DFA_10453 [Cavenderia fasciculata]